MVPSEKPRPVRQPTSWSPILQSLYSLSHDGWHFWKLNWIKRYWRLVKCTCMSMWHFHRRLAFKTVIGSVNTHPQYSTFHQMAWMKQAGKKKQLAQTYLFFFSRSESVNCCCCGSLLTLASNFLSLSRETTCQQLYTHILWQIGIAELPGLNS